MIVLPFVKEMECFMKNFFKKYNTNVVFSTIYKLNSIIILGKDKNVKNNNANLVYKRNCNNCNASYVGQTSRRLNVKIKEHKKKYCDRDQNSSLFTHIKDNNHQYYILKIIEKKDDSPKLYLSIHKKNFINKQFVISRLPYIYNNLINNCEFLVSSEYDSQVLS